MPPETRDLRLFQVLIYQPYYVASPRFTSRVASPFPDPPQMVI